MREVLEKNCSMKVMVGYFIITTATTTTNLVTTVPSLPTLTCKIGAPPLASGLQLEASLWEQVGEDGLALSEPVLSSVSALWGTLGQPSTGGAVPLTPWGT